MRPENIEALELELVTIDTETLLIQAGYAVPALVLGSAAATDQQTGETRAEVLSKDGVLELAIAVLESGTKIWGGANVPFDLLVIAAEAERRGRDLMPEICRLLADDRAWDVLIAQALDAVANGWLTKKPGIPGSKEPMRDPISGQPSNRYSLAITHHQLTGRADAKANDVYRERYAEFMDVPLEDLPQQARDYPVDDARNTHEDALMQVGLLPRQHEHEWVEGAPTRCRLCGQPLTFGEMQPCMRLTRIRNLHDLGNQVRAAFAMAVGAAWGFRVNQRSVDVVERRVEEARERVSAQFIEAGILRWKKEKGELRLAVSMSALARRVAAAYGAKSPCADCAGTGKVPSAKTRGLINCVPCAASGFDLSEVPHLPRTETGRISCTDDSLEESGDELLMTFASEYNGEKKTLQVYVPYLRRARHAITGRDIALTLWPNVILETGRTSYGGSIHQFPRKGGLRECIEARPPQFRIVEVPDDYVPRPGEQRVEADPPPARREPAAFSAPPADPAPDSPGVDEEGWPC